MKFYFVVKRIIDFVCSVLLLIFLLPLLLIITLGIILSTKESPFFLQHRGGYKGNPFKVVKFKTMTNEKNERGELLPDKERLTEIGKFIRRTSLDELPQLLNILIGDMSFIGPRPFLYEYMDVYSENEVRRHQVRPGITGWAQVNGRNRLSWKDKFKLDLFYVDNIGFFLDMKIVFLTIYKVLKKEGVDQNQETIMEKYNGKN